MLEKTNLIFEKLESFKKGATIDKNMIEFVLKTQELVSEALEDVD